MPRTSGEMGGSGTAWAGRRLKVAVRRDEPILESIQRRDTIKLSSTIRMTFDIGAVRTSRSHQIWAILFFAASSVLGSCPARRYTALFFVLVCRTRTTARLLLELPILTTIVVLHTQHSIQCLTHINSMFPCRALDALMPC